MSMSKKDDELNEYIDEVTDGVMDTYPYVVVRMSGVEPYSSW